MFFLSSTNILTEHDASKVTWELFPKTEHGLPSPRLPAGDTTRNIEEAHVLPLISSQGFVMIGRTTSGYLAAAHTASATGADGWSATDYAQYADVSDPTRPLSQSNTSFGGLAAGLKNPRGPITAKNFGSADRWLLIYYNNNGKSYDVDGAAVAAPYCPGCNRNPYFLSAGWEVNGTILWSQPEVAIFGRGVPERPGYPDFITSGGKVWITETQKTTARIHLIPPDLLEALFNQRSNAQWAVRGLLAYLKPGQAMTKLPTWANLSRAVDDVSTPRGAGFSIEATLTRMSEAEAAAAARGGQRVVFDARPGVLLALNTSTGAVTLTLTDDAMPAMTASLRTDPVCSAALKCAGSRHHVVAVVDASALLLRVFVDGVSCDGGGVLTAGWSMFAPLAGALRSASASAGASAEIRVYDRALLASEVVGNFRASTA